MSPKPSTPGTTSIPALPQGQIDEARGPLDASSRDETPIGDIFKSDHVFAFEFILESKGRIHVLEDVAVIRARFRHSGASPINLNPGVDGALNLGIRLYTANGHTQLFEDRMVADGNLIEPNIWVGVSVSVPKVLINSRDQFVLVADMVKEKEYWFSDKGISPSRNVVSFASGYSELDRPNATNTFDSVVVSPPLREAGSDISVGLNGKTNLVFDVSDLVQYFQNARLPTGIQRVQIEVITNLIFSLPDDCSLQIACFTKQTDSWIEVPPLFFNHICKLAVVNGDPTAADWLRVLEELRMHLQQAKRLAFAQGAYLLNLGTSWWLQNYFLHVRLAKAQYGIRYVPYVHDCIPIMTPEHCVEGLTRDFITWALGAFQHADHILVNSNATAKDVKLVAAKLGHNIDEPRVVSLDADYRAANARLPPEMGASANAEIFQRNDIRPLEYVLFVSTIESRKNHLMAFSAWLSLCKRFGSKRIPKLVCVGNRGWLNDSIYSKLSSSSILQQKIAMLSKISDPDLELLYRNCLFTLYPSAYEGWGLPVTESLCFGKIPVLANASSLTEAGGEFGEYFDLGSESALREVLEKLIFDPSYRQLREHNILKKFRPRPWSAIAGSILSSVREWSSVDAPANVGRELFSARGLWPFRAEAGRYYGLTENEHTHIWRGMTAGEMFRQGDGWWWTEPWGCWTKPKGARLAFISTIPEGVSATVFLGIRGVQAKVSVASVILEGVGKRTVKLSPEQFQWLVFRVPADAIAGLPHSDAGVLFEFRFSSDSHSDFREGTGGVDLRIASIGVCGFMVCASTDIEARLSFLESIALSDLNALLAAPEVEVFEHHS